MNLNSPPNFPIRIWLYFGRLKKTGQVNVMASAAGALLIVKKKKNSFCPTVEQCQALLRAFLRSELPVFQKKKNCGCFTKCGTVHLLWGSRHFSCHNVGKWILETHAATPGNIIPSWIQNHYFFFFCLTLTESNLEVALLEEMTKQWGADRTTSVLWRTDGGTVTTRME